MVRRTDASTGQIVDDGQAPKPGGRATMHVKVYSPFRTYFEGEANSLTAENATGTFDILPHHHNFISLLVPCELAIATASGQQKVRISGGVMHVKADQAVIFLDV